MSGEGCINILVCPSTRKHLYQVILLVLLGEISSLVGTSGIVQCGMRLFNVAAG